MENEELDQVQPPPELGDKDTPVTFTAGYPGSPVPDELDFYRRIWR